MEVLLLIGRLAFGLYFLYNGLNHFRKLEMMTGYSASMKVPQPRLAVIVTGLMLLFGGLTLVLGFWAKAGALCLSFSWCRWPIRCTATGASPTP